MPALTFEISPSARAKCKNCKAAIVKGCFRIGTVVEIQEHATNAWRHVACFTARQISNQAGSTASDQPTYETLDATGQAIADAIFESKFLGREDLNNLSAKDQLAGLDKPRPADSSSSDDEDESDESSQKKKSKKKEKKGKSKKSKKDKKKSKKEKSDGAGKKEKSKKKEKREKKKKSKKSDSDSE